MGRVLEEVTYPTGVLRDTSGGRKDRFRQLDGEFKGKQELLKVLPYSQHTIPGGTETFKEKRPMGQIQEDLVRKSGCPLRGYGLPHQCRGTEATITGSAISSGETPQPT